MNFGHVHVGRRRLVDPVVRERVDGPQTVEEILKARRRAGGGHRMFSTLSNPLVPTHRVGTRGPRGVISRYRRDPPECTENLSRIAQAVGRHGGPIRSCRRRGRNGPWRSKRIRRMGRPCRRNPRRSGAFFGKGLLRLRKPRTIDKQRRLRARPDAPAGGPPIARPWTAKSPTPAFRARHRTREWHRHVELL